MSEMKNCPFCGCDKYVWATTSSDKGKCQVMCANCGGCGPPRRDKDRAADGWNMRRDDPFSQAKVDAYEDLRQATPQELLEAVTWWYRQSLNAPGMIELAISFLCTGFALAQPGGWAHVAPMWLRESRKLAALDE